MNTFNKDLQKEKKLGKVLLDKVYKNKFNSRYKIERIDDINKQHQGIDLIITDLKTNNKSLIDEKAQLSYINKTLPTFAFELSYFKNNELKEGWLFDTKKLSDTYFLINAIKMDMSTSLYTDCKIYSIKRKTLINFLNTLGLNKDTLYAFVSDSRVLLKKSDSLHNTNRLDVIYNKNIKICISNFLDEKPANIVINLEYLLIEKIAILIKDYNQYLNE